jgi:hypothetical protein
MALHDSNSILTFTVVNFFGTNFELNVKLVG